MFKGILPSKRISSSEFTMVTNLGDLDGKENLPGATTAPASKGIRKAMAATKGQAQLQDRKKQGDTKKHRNIYDQPTEGLGMNVAFDKLLVSRIYDQLRAF